MQLAVMCGLADTSALSLADALTGAGLRVIAGDDVGMLLGRAGRHVEPMSMFLREPRVLGGRVEALHPRLTLGVAANREQAREVEAVAARQAAPVAVLVCLLPTTPGALGLDADDRAGCRQRLAAGPLVAEAALLSLALAQADQLLVLTDTGDRAEAAVTAWRRGSLDEVERVRLRQAAWRALAGFDRMRRWAAEASDLDAAPGGVDAVTPRTAGDELRHAALPADAPAPPSTPAPPPPPATAPAVETAHAPATPEDAGQGSADEREPAAPIVAIRWRVVRAGPVDNTSGPRRLDSAWTAAAMLADTPRVAVARAGVPVALASLHVTPTRALLRAMQVAGAALTQAAIVLDADLDLTAARAIVAAAAQARPAILAARSFAEAAVEALAAVEGLTLLALDDTGRQIGLHHARQLDAALLASPVATAWPESGAAAARLAATAMAASPLGAAAAIATSDVAVAVCGGQALASDAIQVVVAKARRFGGELWLCARGDCDGSAALDIAKAAGVKGIVWLGPWQSGPPPASFVHLDRGDLALIDAGRGG